MKRMLISVSLLVCLLFASSQNEVISEPPARKPGPTMETWTSTSTLVVPPGLTAASLSFYHKYSGERREVNGKTDKNGKSSIISKVGLTSARDVLRCLYLTS